MGSKLNVPLINPKNQPIEIISDSTDTSHNLVITNVAETITYYNGTIVRKPNETYTGINIQPYLPKPDQCEINFSDLKSGILNNFFIPYKVKLYNTAQSLVYDNTISVANYNVKFTDWVRLKVGNCIGRLRDFINNTNAANSLLADSIQVGGRNLALTTGTPKSKIGDGFIVWPLSDMMMSGNHHLKFRYSISEDDPIGISLGSSTTYDGSYEQLTTLPAGNNLYYECDILFSRDVQTHLLIYTNKAITIDHLKLEIGNRATDWTPAPEDVDASILLAQTSANAANILNYGEMYITQTTLDNWVRSGDASLIPAALPLTQEGFTVTMTSDAVSGTYRYKMDIVLPDGIYWMQLAAKATHTSCSIFFANRISSTGALSTSYTTYNTEFYDKSFYNSTYGAIEFTINHTQGIAEKITIKNIEIRRYVTDFIMPFQQDDWINYNFIYSLCETYGEVYKRYWNKTLKGAPLLMVYNNTSLSGSDVYLGYSTYINKNSDGINTITDNESLVIGTASLYVPPTLTDDYISINLHNETIEYSRSTFFEQIDPACIKGNAYQLYWENTRGGIDWVVMAGENTKKVKVVKNTIDYPVRTFLGDKFVGSPDSKLYNNYVTDVSSSLSLNTVFLDDDQYNYLEELFYSNNVWLYDSKTSEIVKVKITDTDYTHKKYFNNKISNITINVELPYTDYL